MNLSDLNPKTRAIMEAAMRKDGKLVDQPKVKSPIRQNSAGLNKTEQRFLDEWLTPRFSSGDIKTQALTMKLANGVRYTPDFVCCNYEGGILAYEVKGFMRDDAAVKIKVAASTFRWVKFFLATRSKSQWFVSPVLA